MYNLYHTRLTEQAGLRGGRVVFGRDGTIALDEAGFGPGVAVSGRIGLTSEGVAAAALTVAAGGSPQRLAASGGGGVGGVRRAERPALSGTFDGTPFKDLAPDELGSSLAEAPALNVFSPPRYARSRPWG
uniref:Uncharacterized protein n=1 Tax=Nonomuraea gerenzanensis TaxID=93944 RepID=A0A1M4EC42_9ACTN|nr:hypothetical protein BN4615_P5784 [Nonomuraea gerenzanensis]